MSVMGSERVVQIEDFAQKHLPKLVSSEVVTKDMVQSLYSDNAHVYDEVFASVADKYHGPSQAADIIHDHFSSNLDINILDICCGTGVFANELRKRGFHNIDGLDACKNMLEKAKEKKLYQNIVCAYFGSENDTTQDDFYDVVCVCGGFMPGHVPAEALHTMAKKCKKGGLIVNAMREAYLEHPFYKDTYWSQVKSLEEKGIIETVEIARKEKYYEDYVGVICVFRAL